MHSEPFTPRVAALLRDGLTTNQTYGNDVAPSVGITDPETGTDWLRLFQAETDPDLREMDGPRYTVQVDACNELNSHATLIETDDEHEAVSVYIEARDRYRVWQAGQR